MKFETLKERHAKRNPEDLIIDYGDHLLVIIPPVLSWIMILKTIVLLLRRTISKRGR
jgi:hypothetical protein